MIHEAVVSALEPWVGRIIADTCVRATAVSMGKSVTDLEHADMPRLCDNVRRLLTPIAPTSVVAGIIANLEGLSS